MSDLDKLQPPENLPDLVRSTAGGLEVKSIASSLPHSPQISKSLVASSTAISIRG
ncbi:unnamed protein product [Acanthoscelides obtectus]|uniref:Uncharacterized protein n=1 Tax=Acanthoscelides obtectus TaxID=200917 RepID=A0A9P0LG53_ACAOB|nr:unnamed protein product [Acanthoscelides obtectus]CAK1684288.1 hypothetical protein AOBTE_LOCUS34779 [Acanthoscelides obtectus]